MLTGLVLVLLGILIYVNPRIIVAMVSGMLIATGIFLMLLHWRLRRTYRSPDQASNRWTRFLIRF